MEEKRSRPGAAGLLRSRLFLLAVLVNATMGILYVWSLFLYPMEERLHIPRSWLSLAPSLALVFFTIGMIVHDRILRRTSLSLYALVAFGLAGGGHLLFAIHPSPSTLLAGYGVSFGMGSGLGYGLALALATRMPDEVRGLGLGLVMASFAISGVMLSSLLAVPIRLADPGDSFLVIGLAVASIGTLVAFALAGLERQGTGGTKAAVGERVVPFVPYAREPRFLMLGASFFIICYTGLMVVSHATGIVTAQGLSPLVVGFAPATFTSGYIIGSLSGGKLVEAVSGKRALLVANGIAAMGLLGMLVPGGLLVFPGLLAVGMVFGGSASLMPVLIGEEYGVSKIGDVYGKLMVFYGCAGLAAPWATGQMYEMSSSYSLSILICLLLTFSGIAVSLFGYKNKLRSGSGRSGG